MTYVLLASLIWQVVDFLRELANWKYQKSAVVTQATAWGGGMIVVVLAAHAQLTQKITFPGISMAVGRLDWPSQVLLGLLAASLASTGVDIKQAIDNRDTSGKPPLVWQRHPAHARGSHEAAVPRPPEQAPVAETTGETLLFTMDPDASFRPPREL